MLGLFLNLACFANTYSLAGSTSCTACPADSSSGTAAATCVCVAGSALSGSADSLVCTACSAGTYSPSGAPCIRTQLAPRFLVDAQAHSGVLMCVTARTHATIERNSLLRRVLQPRQGIGVRHLPELQHERLQLVVVHVQRWLLADRLGRVSDMHR